MRILAVILSLVIFVQSLAVCGPHFNIPVREEVRLSEPEKKSCHAESKKCCHSKKQDTEEKSKKNHCGQDCKCFCCVKVFFLNQEITMQNYHTPIHFEKNQKPVFIHSFDFHQDVTNPPRA